jgi:4-amino-4-deoxy-L-arabinose transferase-like glycosyltransferase
LTAVLRIRAFIHRLLDQEYSWLRILLLALGIRLVVLALLAGEPLKEDSLYYQEVAQGIVEGKELDTYWPPGLPLYEAIVVWIFGTSDNWLRLAMLPWFFWLCRMFYQLAYRLHSRIAANLGLLFLAVYPAMVHQSVEPLSYLPAAALLLSIFGLLQRYLEARKRGLLWRLGLLIGLLILFRPSAALFLVALPPLIFLRRRKLMPSVWIILFASMVVGAWVVYAKSETSRWVPVNDANSRNLYLGNNAWTPYYKTWYYGSHWTGDPALPPGFRQQLDSLDHLPATAKGRAFFQMTLQEIGRNPQDFARRTLSRMRTLMAFDSFAGTRLLKSGGSAKSLGFVVLALDGLIYTSALLAWAAFLLSHARRELSGRDTVLVNGFLVVYAIPYWISFSHPTYHLPMVPLMLLLACVWGQKVMEKGFQWPKSRNWGLACLVWAILVAIQVEWAIRMM